MFKVVFGRCPSCLHVQPETLDSLSIKQLISPSQLVCLLAIELFNSLQEEIS